MPIKKAATRLNSLSQINHGLIFLQLVRFFSDFKYSKQLNTLKTSPLVTMLTNIANDYWDYLISFFFNCDFFFKKIGFILVIALTAI